MLNQLATIRRKILIASYVHLDAEDFHYFAQKISIITLGVQRKNSDVIRSNQH